MQAEHELDDQHDQQHQYEDEEPTEGFAQLRAPRQVAEMRHDPATEVYEESTEEESQEEEQVEAAEHDEQVSRQAAFTGSPVEEKHEHPHEDRTAGPSTDTEGGREQEEKSASQSHVPEYEAPEQVLPESAPEGKTLEHETFDGEEISDTVQLAQDDASESDMELEEETLEASGSDAGRWIPQVADIEEDIHDHEVEDFEYSGGNGEGAGVAEGEFAEDEGEEDEEEGEELEDSAVAADPNAPPKRRFDRGRRGRRGRNGERGGGGPRMKNIQARNTPLISDLVERRAGNSGADCQGADRQERRAHHQPHRAARALPGLHADGEPHGRFAQDCFRRRTPAAEAHRDQRARERPRRIHRPHGRGEREGRRAARRHPLPETSVERDQGRAPRRASRRR